MLASLTLGVTEKTTGLHSSMKNLHRCLRRMACHSKTIGVHLFLFLLLNKIYNCDCSLE
jgi:hypothetical protein